MSERQDFEHYRPLLFSIAYRMTGTAMDAEDIVQDTYLRYSRVEPSEIQSLKHYLTTITTRLCINKMTSAKTQREQYIGNWLPEPIATDGQTTPGNPYDEVTKLDSISMAFLVLLEQLTPSERAVFILREIFDYEYAELAQILNKSEDSCRKILSRARQHLSANRPRFDSDPQKHQVILQQFLQAVSDGQVEQLVDMLADDAVLVGDGGNRYGAATRPIYGGKHIAAFFNGIRRFYQQLALQAVIKQVNGLPSIIIYDGTAIYAVLTLNIEAGKIKRIHLIGNDDKLKYIR
ncbi:MAG: RNA polymerase sigma-70 factor [Chloroflexota bacterium]